MVAGVTAAKEDAIKAFVPDDYDPKDLFLKIW